MKAKELLNEWLEIFTKERVKKQTYSRYKSLIDLHILPELGESDICELNRIKIQEMINHKMHNGNIRNSGAALSSNTVNLILTVLRLAFEYGCDMGYLDANPCERIKRIPDTSKTVEAFTVEEQIKLENTIERTSDKRFFGIVLCLYTGLRIGELLALEWNDINLETGIICVNKTVYRDKDENGNWGLIIDTPKTKSSKREIPIPVHLLRFVIEQRDKSKGNFVVENKNGERMSIRSYQYMFESLTKKSKVRKLNFHALRHTFATRALESGVDVKTLSEIMGHKNASVTLNRYVHCMMDTKVKMMNKIPRFV